MKKLGFLLFVLVLAAAPANAAMDITLLNMDFIRDRGTPITETHTFTGLAGLATINIYNGAQNDSETGKRVSSSIIKVNSADVFGPSDFNQKVTSLTAQINLNEGDNTIAVQLMGKPGGRIKVEVVQIVEAEAAKVIGPDGGEIKIADTTSPLNGVVLKIPAGAISSNQVITISSPTDIPSFGDGNNGVLPAISLEPNGLTFSIPATIMVPYASESLAENNIFDEGSLQLYLFDKSLGLWFPQEGFVDRDNNLVMTELSHFSTYILNGAKLIKYHYNMLYIKDPVLFVHGVKLGLTSTSTMGDCEETFGLALESLANEDLNVYALNYDTATDITVTARTFARALRNIQEETKAAHVNVIAHSMGGLVARAYIQGMAKAEVLYSPGQTTPTAIEEYKNEVGKLLMMGTPNHGSYFAQLRELLSEAVDTIGDNTLIELLNSIDYVFPEMPSYAQLEKRPDNEFLNELNTKSFPLELTIENACGYDPKFEGDGVVSKESALLEEYGQGALYHEITEHELSKYYHCRIPLIGFDKGIVDVTDPVENHSGYQIMKSFALANDDDNEPSIVSFKFTGHITDGSGSGLPGMETLKIGDQYTGYITYNPNAYDQNAGANIGVYGWTEDGYLDTSFSFSVEFTDSSNNIFYISNSTVIAAEVINNVSFLDCVQGSQDDFYILSQARLGSENKYIIVNLYDSEKNAIESDALPTSIDLADWDGAGWWNGQYRNSNFFQIQNQVYGTCGSYLIKGSIDTFERVEE